MKTVDFVRELRMIRYGTDIGFVGPSSGADFNRNDDVDGSIKIWHVWADVT